MKIFVAIALLVAVAGAYADCGCLKCSKNLHVVSPPAAPCKVIYRGTACSCPRPLPYSVQTPVLPPACPPQLKNYQYKLQAISFDKPVVDVPLYSHSYQVQVPVQQKCCPKYIVGLVAAPDRCVLPAQPCVEEKPCSTGPIFETLKTIEDEDYHYGPYVNYYSTGDGRYANRCKRELLDLTKEQLEDNVQRNIREIFGHPNETKFERFIREQKFRRFFPEAPGHVPSGRNILEDAPARASARLESLKRLTEDIIQKITTRSDDSHERTKRNVDEREITSNIISSGNATNDTSEEFFDYIQKLFRGTLKLLTEQDFDSLIDGMRKTYEPCNDTEIHNREKRDLSPEYFQITEYEGSSGEGINKPQSLLSDIFIDSINWDEILPQIPLFYFVNAPIRMLRHFHRLKGHLEPVVQSVPMVMRTSTKYLTQFGRNFHRSALNFANGFMNTNRFRRSLDDDKYEVDYISNDDGTINILLKNVNLKNGTNLALVYENYDDKSTESTKVYLASGCFDDDKNVTRPATSPNPAIKSEPSKIPTDQILNNSDHDKQSEPHEANNKLASSELNGQTLETTVSSSAVQSSTEKITSNIIKNAPTILDPIGEDAVQISKTSEYFKESIPQEGTTNYVKIENTITTPKKKHTKKLKILQQASPQPVLNETVVSSNSSPSNLEPTKEVINQISNEFSKHEQLVSIEDNSKVDADNDRLLGVTPHNGERNEIKNKLEISNADAIIFPDALADTNTPHENTPTLFQNIKNLLENKDTPHEVKPEPTIPAKTDSVPVQDNLIYQMMCELLFPPNAPHEETRTQPPVTTPPPKLQNEPNIEITSIFDDFQGLSPHEAMTRLISHQAKSRAKRALLKLVPPNDFHRDLYSQRGFESAEDIFEEHFNAIPKLRQHLEAKRPKMRVVLQPLSTYQPKNENKRDSDESNEFVGATNPFEVTNYMRPNYNFQLEKSYDPEKNLGVIKIEIGNILGKIQESIHADHEAENKILQDLGKLQFLKNNLVKDWKRGLIDGKGQNLQFKRNVLNYIKELDKLKSAIAKSVCIKLNTKPGFTKRTLIGVLIKLHQLGTIFNQIFEDFGEKIKLEAKFHPKNELVYVLQLQRLDLTEGDEGADLKSLRDEVIEGNMRRIDNLRRILDADTFTDEATEIINENARLITENNKILKQQATAMRQLGIKVSLGQNFRRELKVVSDFEKHLAENEEEMCGEEESSEEILGATSPKKINLKDKVDELVKSYEAKRVEWLEKTQQAIDEAKGKLKAKIEPN